MNESPHNLCFVCDGQADLALGTNNIFDENEVLESGLRLPEALTQVLGRAVSVDKAHSTLLCSKCRVACDEYDDITLRLERLKQRMRNNFRRTLPNHQLCYDTYNQAPIDLPMGVKLETVAPMKTLVLPKSKLTPLPSMFIGTNQHKVLPGNINKPVSLKNCVVVGPEKLSNFGSSLLSPIAGSSKNAITSTVTKMTSVLNATATSRSTGGFFKTVQSTAHLNQGSSPEQKKGFQSILNNMQSQNSPEKRATLVTEGYTLSGVGGGVNTKYIAVRAKREQQVEGDKFVISEVEIMQEGREQGMEVDEDTILMERDGSVLRVVRGGNGELLFSENSQISLVMPEEGGSDADTNSEYKIEGQDSNDDDGQIELQMSGDEETANAIIAASKNKGATYVKMDSGEMFRIDSVKEESEQGGEKSLAGSPVVERIGDFFKCLLCKKSSQDDTDDAESADADREQGAEVVRAAREMMAHARTQHGARVHICSLCGEVYRKLAHLDRHMLEHGDGKSLKTSADRLKPHQCEICRKKYSSKNLLEEHMNVHTGARPHTCNICQKGFISKYTYQGHMKTHSYRPRPFKCTQCVKAFFTFQNLGAHLKTHTGVKEFVCSTCGKAFSTQHNLDVHSIVHSGSKPFVCAVCEKAFARRAEIRDHMRTHTGERPFGCDMCPATFSQRSNLLSHRRATHLHDRRYECEHCSKRFKRRRLLDYHIKAMHTGERPFKCEICAATFIYPEHYKKHKRIHTGSRPYECEVCSRTFSSRDNRNAHRFTHSDKKPYECLVCGAGFMRKPQLYTHMNTQGHLSNMIVVNQARLVETKDGQEMQALAEDTIVLDGTNKIQTSRSLMASEMSDVFGDTYVCKLTHTQLDLDDEASKDKTIDKLVQDGADEHGLLTLTDNVDGAGGDTDQLEAGDVDAFLAEGSQMITTDEEGNIVRLVQIQLPDGKTGWVALDS